MGYQTQIHESELSCLINLFEPEEAMPSAAHSLVEYKRYVEEDLDGQQETVYALGLLKKAESLYHQTEFEQALVFFHRGAKLRPNMDLFHKGIKKAKKAILNTIVGSQPGGLGVRGLINWSTSLKQGLASWLPAEWTGSERVDRMVNKLGTGSGQLAPSRVDWVVWPVGSQLSGLGVRGLIDWSTNLEQGLASWLPAEWTGSERVDRLVNKLGTGSGQLAGSENTQTHFEDIIGLLPKICTVSEIISNRQGFPKFQPCTSLSPMHRDELIKEVLGPLRKDAKFVNNIKKDHKHLKTLDDELQLQTKAEEIHRFLDNRQDFWCKQNPLYSRCRVVLERDAKMATKEAALRKIRQEEFELKKEDCMRHVAEWKEMIDAALKEKDWDSVIELNLELEEYIKSKSEEFLVDKWAQLIMVYSCMLQAETARVRKTSAEHKRSHVTSSKPVTRYPPHQHELLC
uniref:Uncharacterized protein n=1 Tax=Timema bartmani TaxID=61472 RepID=A0A7R9HX23_9NEOP|nr:unnamed protein product [Timema bartmani]